MSLGSCGEYLEHSKPKIINKLCEIMQEYCISDKGKWWRIKEMNEQQARNRDRPKPHQTDQTKNPKPVNTVSNDKAHNSRPQVNRGGATEATTTMHAPY